MINHQTETPRHEYHQSITVLLVDDQRFVGLAVKHLLSSAREIVLHHCVSASRAIAHANEVRPDVILQDLVMPDIDGLTLVGLFRQNALTAATPIVVLSGNDDASARAGAASAGANDYLVKLPTGDVLAACLRRHAPPAPSGPGTDEAVDRQVLADICGPDLMNSEIARHLVSEFLNEATVLVAAIRDAASRQDAAKLRFAAHALKGTALTMGARRLAMLSGAIEDHAQHQSATPVAHLVLTAIEDEFGRVRTHFTAERDAHTPLNTLSTEGAAYSEGVTS